MHGLGLAGLRVPPARLHAPRLEALAIAAGGDLAVLALARQPDLQVVGLGAAEADIARAQRHDAVRQPEPLQHLAGVAGQFLQRRVGIPRPDHVHQLDLVELVLPDHAARVLAVGARLGTEAGRVGHEPQRQGVRFDDLLAHQVGQRHFRRRDQVQVLQALLFLEVLPPLQREQVGLELRQLARPRQRLARHQVGHVGLRVAMLSRVQVEHELRQRSMQPRHGAAHHGEAGPGDPRRRLEVEPAELLAERDMVQRREVQLPRLSPAAKLDVGRLVPALGHRLMEQVGDAQQQRVERRLLRRQPLVGALELVAERLHFRQQRGEVLPLRLGPADRLRAGIALVAQAVDLDLQGLAALLQRNEGLLVEGEATPGQVGHHRVEIAAQQPCIQHCLSPAVSDHAIHCLPTLIPAQAPVRHSSTLAST